jgi:asparagine synthase (glutamine-hydrolysing)
MCGISGLVDLSGEPVSPRDLEAMSCTLVHRGPDSEGAFLEGPVGLAARRLSIIDLETGDQPRSNEDGTIRVVQNGEIYNYRELRERLVARGHRFTSRGDTEVLAHLYEDEGIDFVRNLRGMFAIALWDARNERFVLARDPFGIKPLHYRRSGQTLAFASELKALVTVPGFRTEVDLDALDGFLADNWIAAPATIYRGVRKLPAGHRLVWERAGGSRLRIERYTDIRPNRQGRLLEGSDDELAEELLFRLRDSVRAHLVSDVPVGVLLSGGIDSSALVALAVEASPARIRTFSIGFEERSYDELDKARRVAERYDTDHHELVVRPDAAALLPILARVFDEPFADNSALPTYLVSELAARHVKVVLSGEGGDELFGGYQVYLADRLAPKVGRIARLAAPLVERLPATGEHGAFDHRARKFVAGATLPPAERHQAWRSVFTPEARAALVRPDRQPSRDYLDVYRAHYADSAGAEPIARMSHLDIRLYLADDLLAKTDRASMAHSLETRVPFLDPVVAEFAMALPDRQRIRGLAKKVLLRRAVAPILPEEILRAPKHGFSLPAALWLRNELQPLVRDVLAPDRVRREGFFRPEVVTALVDDHISGRRNHDRQLWGLLAFSLWLEHGAPREAHPTVRLGDARLVEKSIDPSTRSGPRSTAHASDEAPAKR